MAVPFDRILKRGLLAAGAAGALPLSAQAAKPVDWQIWHQDAGSPGMEAIIAFDWWTLYFVVPITIFVMVLLAYVMIKFRAGANPVPSKTTHNTAIEVVWTLAPVAILVAIAIPSFQLLTSQFNPPKEPTVTVKATGHQWYWGYEYQATAPKAEPGEESAENANAEPEVELSFDSRPIGVKEIAGDEEKAQAERVSLNKTDMQEYPRLLAVDNELVVPVNEVVRVLVTAGDVIHNFAMPAFGLKMDGYPGRLNETFFMAAKEGIYYGQCSELCGKFHAYMPIAIRVVSAEDYATWKADAANDVGAANKALMARLDERKKTVDVAGN